MFLMTISIFLALLALPFQRFSDVLLLLVYGHRIIEIKELALNLVDVTLDQEQVLHIAQVARDRHEAISWRAEGCYSRFTHARDDLVEGVEGDARSVTLVPTG